MRTYTITRDGELIGRVTAFSRTDAASAYARRLQPKALALRQPDGTYQAMIHHPKLRRNDPISEPFAVEAA